jgi:hypothetical protein
MWRQGFGEYLFPYQSPFSTAGLPAALEAAASGGQRERPSALLLLLIVYRLICSSSVYCTSLYKEHKERL